MENSQNSTFWTTTTRTVLTPCVAAETLRPRTAAATLLRRNTRHDQYLETAKPPTKPRQAILSRPALAREPEYCVRSPPGRYPVEHRSEAEDVGPRIQPPAFSLQLSEQDYADLRWF